MRILLIDDEDERAQLLTDALIADGHVLLARGSTRRPVIDQIRACSPDLVIVAMASADRDALEQLRAVGQDLPRPIVMFVDRSERAAMVEAIQAGVAAYIIDGIEPHRVRNIIDVAVAQFREFQSLREQLVEAKASLAERKLIDRAKGIIMARRNCTEPEAYAELRKHAMNRGLKLGQMAENIITVTQLLSG